MVQFSTWILNNSFTFLLKDIYPTYNCQEEKSKRYITRNERESEIFINNFVRFGVSWCGAV